MNRKRELILGISCNVLEWYNFALFMPFLPILSRQFFPQMEGSYREIITFLVLSMGLFMRPFGSMFFGPIGDKFGRQKALSLSILVMAIATFGIAMLPGYSVIGVMAPILLAIFRALQGISMGGAYTSAMVHLVEQAAFNRRGFFGCLSDAGSQLGVLLGGQSLVMLYIFFSNNEIYNFAWKIPFFLSLFLMPFAFLLRPQHETQAVQSNERLITSLIKHKKSIFCSLFITSFSAVFFYTLFTFLPYHLSDTSVMSLKDIVQGANIANIVMIPTIMIFGYLSDVAKRRKPFLIIGIIGAALSLIPLMIINTYDTTLWLCLNASCGFFIGMYYSSRSAFFSEAFPKHIRCTAVSVSLSFAQAIFGGLSPSVTQKLIDVSHAYAIIPILFVLICALISLLLLKDKVKENI